MSGTIDPLPAVLLPSICDAAGNNEKEKTPNSNKYWQINMVLFW